MPGGEVGPPSGPRSNPESPGTCEYCGAVLVPDAVQCHECGTPLVPPLLERPITTDELTGSKATLILLAYLGSQFFISILLVTIAFTVGDPESRASRAYLPPTLLLSFLGSGAVFIGISRLWIRNSLRDTSETGAAWVLGARKMRLQGLALGAILASCFVGLLHVFPPNIDQESAGPLTRMGSTPGWSRAIWLVLALVLAPPTEELLFRGVLYGGYRKALGRGWAAVLTTFIFVLLHITETIHFPPGFAAVIGMALLALWMRLRSAAIGPAIAVHFGYNAVITLGTLWS